MFSSKVKENPKHKKLHFLIKMPITSTAIVSKLYNYRSSTKKVKVIYITILKQLMAWKLKSLNSLKP